MFGAYIKEKRLARGLTLREFCRQLEEDASNWSKIERETMAPPKDKNKLERIANILGIKKGSDEWDKLIDMAYVDAGLIPEYLMSDREVIQSLPLFFRTIRSVKPTKEELEELIENIRKGI